MAETPPTPDVAEFAGPNGERAWEAFINAWGGRLLALAQRHAPTPDEAQDCFLFLCEALVTDRFHRLRQFDADRGVPFGGWLNAVASRLCIDWLRHRYGRRRMPGAIEALPILEQRVYHLAHVQRLERAECLEALRIEFPGADERRLGRALAEVHRALSAPQRWRLQFINRPPEQRTVSRQAGHLMLVGAPLGDNVPEACAERSQRHEALRKALATLSAEDRLLLRLRFEQHLSLEQTARIAGLANLHQARRRIERALEKLRLQLAG